MLLNILADAAEGAQGGSMLMPIISIILLFAIMYFLMIRPQKKEQKKKEALLNEVAIGDTVLTTSGFYGTVIDMQDDTVIVEFGNNRNCRIPMTKSAIADVEKPEDSVAKPEAKADETEKPEKKSLFGKKRD